MYPLSTCFSFLSTVCWIFALIPQQIHNYKLKSVVGLSPYLLLLWFMGDFCNFIGCILTDQLPFQTYLSFYFIINDIIIDFQYIYYNYGNINNNININNDINNNNKSSGIIELISDTENNDNYDDNDNITKNYDATVSNNLKPLLLSKSQIITTTTALISISPTNALPISLLSNNLNSKFDFNIGLFFAWLCTIIYCSSRLPQLYHNYLRKSVDGISPLLFTFALLANLTYALSILLSNSIPQDLTYKQFIWNELPYLLGSLGTVLFDCIYFWQREIYRVVSI